MATGLIFNDARVQASTTTCYWLTATSQWYDLTPFVQSVRINLESDVRDNTVMGMSYRSQLRALKTATVELRCLQSFSVVDEIVFTCGGTGRSLDLLVMDLYNAEAKTVIAVRPDNAVRSSCNPEYIMPASLLTHTPMDGAVADLLLTPLRFGSQGDMTRVTCST